MSKKINKDAEKIARAKALKRERDRRYRAKKAALKKAQAAKKTTAKKAPAKVAVTVLPKKCACNSLKAGLVALHGISGLLLAKFFKK